MRGRLLILAAALIAVSGPPANAQAPTPTPTLGAAPAPAPTTAATPAPSPTTTASDGVPAVVVVALALIAILALVALVLALMRRLSLAEDRLAPASHAWREAAWRAGGTWEAFMDWLRLGR